MKYFKKHLLNFKKTKNISAGSINSPQVGSVHAKGFTLVELLVSISIMLIIISVIFFNHQKFNDSLLVTNLAYELALSIREAQIYGSSVKSATVGSEQKFDVGYGVHFALENKTTYFTFVDKNNNKKYENSGGSDPNSELLSILTIGRGNIIEDICGIVTNTEHCYSSGPLSSATSLDITFARPYLDAVFKFYDNEGELLGGIFPSINEIRIKLKSPQGVMKEVSVINTGQISIK